MRIEDIKPLNNLTSSTVSTYGVITNEMKVAGEPAMWISLVKKALAASKNIYFASGGNRVVAINDKVSPGVVRISLENRKTGKKQSYTIAANKSDEWTLQKFEDGHRLTMLQNIKEEVSDDLPMVVRLMNKRLNKKGAVKVDVSMLPVGKRLKGWITEPLEFMPAHLFGGRDGWKGRIRADSGGIKVIWFDSDADQHFTLRSGKDGNGNTYIELIKRGDR